VLGLNDSDLGKRVAAVVVRDEARSLPVVELASHIGAPLKTPTAWRLRTTPLSANAPGTVLKAPPKAEWPHEESTVCVTCGECRLGSSGPSGRTGQQAIDATAKEIC
jgi:hypothetical protein